jgi:ABC-2 type transport system permease protein
MNAFKGFVIKEFKQIIRDRRTLVVLFGMPVIMLILFGFAIRNEANNVQIAIYDQSKDDLTKEIVQKMDASKAFTVVDYIASYKEIEQVFKEGEIKEVVVFAPDFKRNIVNGEGTEIQIITDATDPNLATIVQSYTSAVVRDFMEEQAGDENPSGIQPVVTMLYNPELKSVNLFVPGLIAVILMLVSALMTSISITKEKEMGNMEILLVSPLKPVQIIIGKVIPYLFLSIINVVVILILAEFIFKVPFRGSYLFFMVEAVLFIITALSLGVFISSVTNNQQTAMMIALAGLLLPTVLLSGFIFPIDSMPFPLQMVSHAIPAKWFLIIVRGIMLKGVGIAILWKETVVLLGISGLFIALSIKKFKVRLQ